MIANNMLDHTGNYYWSTVLIVIGWSITEIHMKTGIDAYVREFHEGKISCIQMLKLDYSLGIFFYSVGSVVSFLLLMINNHNLSLIVLICVGACIAIVWVVRLPLGQILTSPNKDIVI